MRLPNRRDASRERRRARIDEQLAIVRVIHARARKRYAETTLQLLERTEPLRERLRAEQEIAADRLGDLTRKLRRRWRLVSRR